ncbi:hypothetical protein GCM10023323_48240 [Streptomyces thinghirensis]|uniref:Secreted protein n=1 Tax=Streptomyces thinghirensis TaxID=551547 RepID=A0ABP9TB37_9ACTN
MACSVIGILFSMLRVFCEVSGGVWLLLSGAGATKNPSCHKASEGSAPGVGRGESGVGPDVTCSADALSKYENSGAHGTDLPPGTPPLSSGWDGSLIM